MLGDRAARRWVVVGALALVGVGLWLVLAVWNPSGVPDEFTDRRSLPDCGRTAVGVGELIGRAVTDVGREKNECFDAALAEGTGAELVVETSSVEGEPVFEYLRALPGGGVEVFIDSRGGGFGPASWSYFRCSDAQTFVVARSECEFREL